MIPINKGHPSKTLLVDVNVYIKILPNVNVYIPSATAYSLRRECCFTFPLGLPSCDVPPS